MLSLAKLGRGSEGYYFDAVAKGAEDYYVGRGEAPGYWAGRGAELLDLDGEVTPEALRAVLAGTAPDGSMVGAANRNVPGFDLTFSVPKSVSILAALRPELSELIVDACEIAVARSIAWLEEHACFSRRGHNGVEHVDGDGYVAAAFRHRTSRAGDLSSTGTCSSPTPPGVLTAGGARSTAPASTRRCASPGSCSRPRCATS